MYRKQKRSKDAVLQLKCGQCGGKGEILGNDFSHIAQCKKCGCAWDCVAHDTESTVYNQMRKKHD